MMCFGVKERKRSKTNHCVIVLLDDTQLVHELHASSTGQDLLDVVIKHLNLLETSYFGLKFLLAPKADSAAPSTRAKSSSSEAESAWLDVNKSAIKQLRDVRPMTVYFAVKYYASDPCKLAEEITRYQFFLQCKQDILHQRLPVEPELAVELFALAVQSELGDFDPQRHLEGYVSEFQFLAEQPLELERRVAAYHRQLTGQVPATAELNFLERVKWLDLYGCELHPIQYEEGSRDEYALGLNPSGVLVLRNKLKVAHYLWPRIVKTKTDGRCFLMDVIDNRAGSSGSAERNRFGFRLADKAASQRLRWSIEEHKSFYLLVHSSASLNQLAAQRHQQQQQQQQKLSQRFRNSIRSAISLGPFAQALHQQQAAAAAAAAAHAQQQHKLRSSMKSLSKQAAAMLEQQQHYALDAGGRPQPTVVRMPSRRYSNRSLTRPSAAYVQANGNGLPQPGAIQGGAGQPHTMVDSQRQQALMMMNQFNQMNMSLMAAGGKSQTLKPMPVSAKLDSKEAKKNPYYYQMMMMMAAAANQQQQQQQLPEVSILPPGRHIVQPAIYKATSVLNGVNQLGAQPPNSAMMQFFNTRPQYPAGGATGYSQAGHESPRSTKSAIAPSSALKLASKKLAKQQQLLYAANQSSDVQPLLAYELNQQQQRHLYALNGDYYAPQAFSLSTSANASPRSVRSTRSAMRHKSKSTNENLHLLHKQQQQHQQQQQQLAPESNKMLLATTQMLQQQQQQQHLMGPPPPAGYHNSDRRSQLHSDNESDASKRSAALANHQVNAAAAAAANAHYKKRATFALSNEQASNLLQVNGAGQRQTRGQRAPTTVAPPSDGEDDYCCSRSDCSSVLDHQAAPLSSLQQQQQSRRSRAAGVKQPAPDYQQQQQQVRRTQGGQQMMIDGQEEWNAIRQRHSEFSSGKGFLVTHNGCANNNANSNNSLLRSAECGANRMRVRAQQNAAHQELEDMNNNNSLAPNGNNNRELVKSIANKQATPILLSLNYDQSNANNKAVQLLNLQRQQLNSQSSSDASHCTKSLSSALDSAPSSVASSPQAPNSASRANPATGGHAHHANKTSDSAASSSTTTSGYYAGTNSTGSGSADSDSSPILHEPRPANGAGPQSLPLQMGAPGGKRQPRGGANGYAQQAFNGGQWQEEGSRAKIAIGSYAQRMAPGNRLLIGPAHQVAGEHSKRAAQKQEQFYLGEKVPALENFEQASGQQQAGGANQQWPLSQIQQQEPASLRCVTFDV